MTRCCGAFLALAVVALATVACAAEETSDVFLSVTASDFVDWCDDTMCLMPAMDIHYNRVDGILFYLGIQYLNDSELHPRVKAMRGWTSAREASYYQIEFEQPIMDPDRFSAGVQLYEKTSWSREDAEAISDLANNLGAFVARTDRRDYFTRRGVTVFTRYRVNPRLAFRMELRNDELSSLATKQSVWTVFGRDEDWRENPPLMVGVQDAAVESEGRMKSVVASVRYDSRDERGDTGWAGSGSFEFAGGGMGGDYKFRKYALELAHYARISRTQTLDLTARWGVGSGTDYPSHKLFYLGGQGDLRGYEHKEFSGKNMLFARAEYGIDVRPHLRAIFFVDSGSAWYGGGDVSGEFMHDFGIGFRSDTPGVGDIRVDIARAATSDESDIFIYFDIYF